VIDERSSEELMAEFNRCNDMVLNTIIRRHNDSLTGYIYAKVLAKYMGFGDETMETARDLTQDTWVKVATKKGSYNPGVAKFTTWLYKIGNNLALNELRRRKPYAGKTAGPQGPDPNAAMLNAVPDPAPSPLRRARKEQAREALTECLGTLNPGMYEVVTGRARMGREYKEMAVISGLPESTLRKRFERAVKRLNKCLQKKGFSMDDFV